MQTSMGKLPNGRIFGCLWRLPRKPDLFTPQSRGHFQTESVWIKQGVRISFHSILILWGDTNPSGLFLSWPASHLATLFNIIGIKYSCAPTLTFQNPHFFHQSRSHPSTHPPSAPFILIFKHSLPVFQSERSPIPLSGSCSSLPSQGIAARPRGWLCFANSIALLCPSLPSMTSLSHWPDPIKSPKRQWLWSDPALYSLALPGTTHPQTSSPAKETFALFLRGYGTAERAAP